VAEFEARLQALANQSLGVAYRAQGDYRRAIGCFGQTVAFFAGAQRHERFGELFLPAVLSRAYLATCHAELGTFAEGRTLGDEGLQIAEAVAHPSSLMYASWGIGLLCLRQGDLPRVLPRLERAVSICQDVNLQALALADELGMHPLLAHCHFGLGILYTQGGHPAQARAELAAAIELYRAMEMTFWLERAEAVLAQIA
jgi:tetratricopeptide (TPR) repeat protein